MPAATRSGGAVRGRHHSPLVKGGFKPHTLNPKPQTLNFHSWWRVRGGAELGQEQGQEEGIGRGRAGVGPTQDSKKISTHDKAYANGNSTLRSIFCMRQMSSSAVQ